MTTIKTIKDYRIEIVHKNDVEVPRSPSAAIITLCVFVGACGLVVLAWSCMSLLYNLLNMETVVASISSSMFLLLSVIAGISLIVFANKAITLVMTPKIYGCGCIITIEKYGYKNDGGGVVTGWSTVSSASYLFTEDPRTDSLKIQDIIIRFESTINGWYSTEDMERTELQQRDDKCRKGLEDRLALRTEEK